MVEFEREPPSYAGQIRREVHYCIECFECGEELWAQGGTQRRAIYAAHDRGWRDIDPDGWCCSECRKHLRKAGGGGE